MRLAGLNAYTRVNDSLEGYVGNRGQPPTDLRPWLTWEMSAERNRELRAPPRWSGPGQNGNPRLAETQRDHGPAEVLLLAAQSREILALRHCQTPRALAPLICP